MGNQSVNLQHADVKSPLIDLEADNTATGGKQELIDSVQPERLSEENNVYCVYWIYLIEHKDRFTEGYVGMTSNFKNRMKSHRKSKSKSHFNNAKNKYGWDNLNKVILHQNLSLEECLKLELYYRPNQNIGWNSQKGGIIGVEKEWYNISENKIKHSLNTSIATKKGIALKDTKEKRSKRAVECSIKYKDKYKKCFSGDKNPRALLKNKDVIVIKCELFQKGLNNKEISLLYNVKPYVINFIRREKNWKHIVCDSPDHK